VPCLEPKMPMWLATISEQITVAVAGRACGPLTRVTRWSNRGLWRSITHRAAIWLHKPTSQ
jgi:hypothetical protein